MRCIRILCILIWTLGWMSSLAWGEPSWIRRKPERPDLYQGVGTSLESQERADTQALASIQKVPLTLPSGWRDSLLNPGARQPWVTVFIEGKERLQGLDILWEDIDEQLTTALDNTGRFRVRAYDRATDKEELKEAFEALGFYPEGIYLKALVTEVLRDRFVDFGEVYTKTAIRFDAKAVDMKQGFDDASYLFTQEVISPWVVSKQVTLIGDSLVIKGPDAPTVRRDYRKALNEAMQKMVRRIEEVFPIIGTVVDLPPNQVTINVGLEHGVRKGQIYIIVEKGRSRTDPITGEDLGFRKTVVASMEVVQVDQQTATGNILDNPTDRAIALTDPPTFFAILASDRKM